MMLILVGFLCIALDVLLKVGNTAMVLELPPDVLGYLLIGMGATRFRMDSRNMDKLRSFGWVSAAVSGFLFMLRLLSLSYAPVSVVIILELAELALMVIVVYLLMSYVKEKEQITQLPLYSKVLWWLWIALMAVLALNYVGQLIPLLGSITSLVSDLLCLAVFLLLWNAFQLLKEAEEEE